MSTEELIEEKTGESEHERTARELGELLQELRVANRFAIAGMVLLALAMMGAMFVITDVLFGSISASVAAVLIAAFFLYVWFVVPIRYRMNGE